MYSHTHLQTDNTSQLSFKIVHEASTIPTTIQLRSTGREKVFSRERDPVGDPIPSGQV